MRTTIMANPFYPPTGRWFAARAIQSRTFHGRVKGREGFALGQSSPYAEIPSNPLPKNPCGSMPIFALALYAGNIGI
jgi:hypothetical protein